MINLSTHKVLPVRGLTQNVFFLTETPILTCQGAVNLVVGVSTNHSFNSIAVNRRTYPNNVWEKSYKNVVKSRGVLQGEVSRTANLLLDLLALKPRSPLSLAEGSAIHPRGKAQDYEGSPHFLFAICTRR